MTTAPPSQEWQSLTAVRRALAITALGLATAIATGLSHTVILGLRRYALGGLVWYGREFVWAAPIAYSAVFLPATVALALTALLSPRRWILALSAGALATLGAFGILLPFTQIARAASLLLAIGIGVQMARLVLGQPAAWFRRSRRTVMAAVVLLPLVALLQRQILYGSIAAPRATPSGNAHPCS